MKTETILILLSLAALFLSAGCAQTNPPKACTEEARLCPDGTAVGRVGPNCEFAPCPNMTNCTCPQGYVQEGDVCTPACYYSTPKCLMPSILCNATQKTLEQACINSGGNITTKLCCKLITEFPDTCLIGACGCSPDNSHEINACNCGTGRCWDSSKSQCITLDN